MTTLLRRSLVLLCLLLAVRAVAVEPALIGVGETWAFWPATNEPPAAWREPQFDDSQWRRSESGFGTSNRGENTFFVGLPMGSGTVCFRREFAVANPAEVAALIFRVDWRGGFVAYLNGAEVIRRGLGQPGAALSYTNRSEERGAGWGEDLVLTNYAAHLRPGTNLLAVEVHPTVNPLSEIVFVPELLANFSRGPYLQNTGPGRMEVLWRTPLAGPTSVEFGPTEALGMTVPATTAGSQSFSAAMTHLPPGTRHHYRVKMSTAAGEVVSPTYSFRTLPAEGPVTALMFGDSGTGGRGQFAVARQFQKMSADADVFVHLGDVIYPWFHYGQTDSRCLSVYREVFRSLPCFMTWGNHDLMTGPGAFEAAFRLPTNSTPALDHLEDRTQPNSYYSFDAGDAHFSVLYLPYGGSYMFRTNGPQSRWLEADLAASAKRWKFLCLHHPVNTSGLHRFDDYNTNRIQDRFEIQDVLLPLAQRHGVRAIFSGHDHDYERFQPVGRVTTLVAGGGGAGLYPLNRLDPNSACFYLRWHVARLEVREDTLRWTAVDTEGVPVDVWEFRDTPAGSADADGDGLGDLAEELAGSDPTKPDTDGDGLPDGWEFLRGLDPATASVQRSADGTVGPGDPRLLAEVLAQPIPRPATELWAHPLPDGRIQLRWLGVVGKRIQLEAAPSPGGDYRQASEAPSKPLGEDRQALELPTESAARYFRVRAVSD